MNKRSWEMVSRSSTSIIIACGTFSFHMEIFFDLLGTTVLNTKTFLLPSNWFTNSEILHLSFKAFNGSLGFLFLMNDGPEHNNGRELLKNPYDTDDIKQFLVNVHPFKYPDDKWLEDIWMLYFGCLSPRDVKNNLFERFYVNKKLHNCSGKENVTELRLILNPDDTAIAYNALITMAYALHAMLPFLGREDFSRSMKKSINGHKVKYTSNKKRLYYNERGELNTIFHLYNWISIGNRFSTYRHMGSYTPWAPPDQQLSIKANKVIWKNNKIPRSQCSENCPPGTRKMENTMLQICCYDCVICSEGEISNKTDSEKCIKCLDTEWSSSKRDKCFPKLEEFLSFTNGISIALSSISLIFWAISVLTLGIFVSHKDTAIVKANNKNLSFILLISLSLCFLSMFLFIGRPVDRTWTLRQIVFGIIFSIAVSSVLAKTILVYMAFKISRPGNRWKGLIGVKVSNSIVVGASSIEVIISIIWLYFAPPYLEQDTKSYRRKVIIQCNEGSQAGFFAVLGYLFFLAAVSLTVAYLARTLPDRFNEAKYITFSMLIFCSVCIAMVPSYLSTKGKNMLVVEIFSIFASSAGLLNFIFFPKCDIIFVKPQLNRK
ncbi:vomeronasal type-2 receptor, partial [Pristimantis euphronides]